MNWVGMHLIAKRTCPQCRHKNVDAHSLHSGTECAKCQKIIEVDFFYSAGIPVVLTLLLTGLYELGMHTLAHLHVFALVVFTLGYRRIFSRYLPLKHYE